MPGSPTGGDEDPEHRPRRADRLPTLPCRAPPADPAFSSTDQRGEPSAGPDAQQAQLLCFAQHLWPSFGELAALLHCDKTNITGLVDRLQRRGLLTRQPDPDDRRVTRVHLTPEGEALTGKVQQAISTALTSRFDSWPSSQRDDLLHLLRAATSALRA